ncbi:hypothetical protein BDV95DRAFT_498212 [Massariosphaeria phaeospora]|uniref:Transmembrane protein n=1 Tax=Massariosphaeria phaeospora TaxID=100035 RepID=A0A7C8M7A7_9PLEO|nr:hypothetical protein BDV95DRAFT_498212 [Massariosphaeria phaeospora]
MPVLKTPKRRLNESAWGHLFRSINLPTLHLLACAALAFSMAFRLDGYLAVPEDSLRFLDGGRFKLKVADVTTLISTALTIIRIIVQAWVGTIMWNCAFILLEKRGLTLPQVNRIMSFNIPPIPKSYADGLVVLLLFLVIPQQFISPLLSGSVGWTPSFEYSQAMRLAAAGSLEASAEGWFWYYYSTVDRRANIRRAAAMTALAWDGSAVDRMHCRHVLNDDPDVVVPVNSTLYGAVIPCIRIHSIEFPTVNPPAKVFKIANDSVYNIEEDPTRLSRVEEPPLRYSIPGNAVLFDPEDRPGLHDNLPPEGDLTPEGYFERHRPTDYLQDGVMSAVILLGIPALGTVCEGYNASIFGTTYHNKWRTTDHGNYEWCHTYAIVNLTAGVADSPQSTYVTNRVVEANLPTTELDIRAGPWVQEAMYLMPDVMSNVALMNTTSLYTWDDLDGYLDKLVRYSYQGAWDMLSRSYDPNATMLEVQYYESRVRASVSRARVFAWLVVSVLLTLSSAVLAAGKKRLCERGVVFDGPVAALVTDARVVVDMGEADELTSLAYVGKEKGVGEVRLQRNDDGGFHLVPKST